VTVFVQKVVRGVAINESSFEILVCYINYCICVLLILRRKIHTSPSMPARLRSFSCVYSSYESDWSDSAAVFMSALRARIVQAVLRGDLPNWPSGSGSVCGVVGIARRDCCSVVSPHSCASRAYANCEHRRDNKPSWFNKIWDVHGDEDSFGLLSCDSLFSDRWMSTVLLKRCYLPDYRLS